MKYSHDWRNWCEEGGARGQPTSLKNSKRETFSGILFLETGHSYPVFPIFTYEN